MADFNDRINLNIGLNELAKHVCSSYGFGEFEDCKIIEIGYEDFNFILNTKTGKYFVKIFSNERSDEHAKNLVDRYLAAIDGGIKTPKIYKVNGEALCMLEIGDVTYRVVVFEFIAGKTFFEMGVLPTIDELKLIAIELAKLNEIDFRPPFTYDHWAIINYEAEYKENSELIDAEYKPLVDLAYKKFLECDLKKLKYGYVHGDIIETNVIKDLTGGIHFIDFSVSNYQPRIVDLAITICDLCVDINDIETSKMRTKIFIEAYESVSKLSNYEKECLNTFIICHQAISVLETTREKIKEHNATKENEQFLHKSKIGLKMAIKEKLF